MKQKIKGIYAKSLKRVLDFILAFIGLIIISPVLVIITIYIILDSGFPVIYKQNRVGMYGRDFTIYKFRTMVRDADQLGPSSTSQDDSRITRAGRFLRKTSLDELPQLFNVLNGTMSLVGYRPDVRRRHVNYLEKKYDLRPGITGYAQTHGRSSITQDEKRCWESRYTQDVSFKTDIRILLDTVNVVLKHKNSN